jgi:hypothetical protein
MAGWLDDKGGHVRLYYIVGGSLTVAIFENNTWYEAEPVPTVLPPKADESSSASKGLSDGEKAGIGVGAFFGAFALVALFGAIIFIRRRRRQQKQEEEAAAAQLQAQQAPPYYHGDGMYQAYPPYDAQQGHMSQISGQTYTYVPAISPEPIGPKPGTVFEINELPERDMRSYEMLGEGHFREMPADGQTPHYVEPYNSETGDIPIRYS